MIATLPLDQHLFVLSRLRYLAAAVTNHPNFKPDGKPPQYFQDLPALAQQSYAALLTRYNAANLADAAMLTAHKDGHDLAVSVYACMKSCYRGNSFTVAAIRKVPKGDRTPEQTLARMKGLSSLWGQLPPVPGTSNPFVVGATTVGSFGSQTTDFDSKLSTARKESSNYAGELAEFHKQLNAWDSEVSAATTQGRALYKPGTAERAAIDRIPQAPSTQKPGAAEFTTAQSEAPGLMRLEFGAPHATSFKVFHKGPADAEFAEVADVLLPGAYGATGLPVGLHQYYIVPENSRGAGPASAVVSVAVAASLAA